MIIVVLKNDRGVKKGISYRLINMKEPSALAFELDCIGKKK